MHAADPAHLFGCDPWEAAIELCREARIPCDLKVTPYLPERLPYPDHSVDLAYAFSVFTHTSERASRHALRALHRAVRPGGILVVTIRPVSYWSIHSPLMEGERVTLQAAHDSVGFAFKPHERTPVDGDVTYGDTSLTVETLQRLAPGWLVLHEQILPESPFQRIVYLRAGELPD
jgi:SAM-dependent methyltransferase